MDIDNNELEKRSMQVSRQGDRALGVKLEDEFLAQFREYSSHNDHCSCTAACRHHGNCKECVAIHRAHRDHLPNCFHDMVHEKLVGVSALIEYKLEKE